MNNNRFIAVSLSVALLAGCAQGISSRQKMELETYEARGLAVNEKSPGAAAALGILPGGGSFYGRAYALGVVNLLFWPLSICWDPVSGYDAATRINYIETKQYIAEQKNREMNELNQKRMSGLIDDYTYNMELVNISQTYDLNPIAQPMVLSPVNRTPSSAEQSIKDQKIRELQQQNLSYGEYQRRYNEIMAE